MLDATCLAGGNEKGTGDSTLGSVIGWRPSLDVPDHLIIGVDDETGVTLFPIPFESGQVRSFEFVIGLLYGLVRTPLQ